MRCTLGRWVFKHDDSWGYVARPFGYSLAFFVLLLFVAVSKDRRGGCSINIAGGCAGRSW